MTEPRQHPELLLSTSEPTDGRADDASKPGGDAIGEHDTVYNPGFHVRRAAHIRALPPQVFNQIAAGEVIERPANVVKEAIENSLDALATRIDVEIEDGGKRLIRLSDNGHGIPASDLALALSPHATSKLTAADQIASIATFGFRGEALASIASIAEVTLRSRPRPEAWSDPSITDTPSNAAPDPTDAAVSVTFVADPPDASPPPDAGAELTVEAGQFHELRPCGMPIGTILEVRRLFAHTPVRLKFLKGTPTELSHVVQVVTRAALANPTVAFSLTHNGRSVCEFHAGETLRERFGKAFGPEADRHALAVASYAPPVEGRVEGFVCNPAHTKPNSGQIWLFLNGRFIRDKQLSTAVTQAFRDYVPHGRYPVACLFVTLEPRRFDVNVHPQKLEVRFRDPRALFGRILRAVRERLVGALPPQVRLPDAMPVAHRAMVQDLLDATDDAPPSRVQADRDPVRDDHARDDEGRDDDGPSAFESGANRTRGALFPMGRGATLPMPFPMVDPHARSQPTAADLDPVRADARPWGPFPTDGRDAELQQAITAPAADRGLPPRARDDRAATPADRQADHSPAQPTDSIAGLLASLPAFADHPAQQIGAETGFERSARDRLDPQPAPSPARPRGDDAPRSVVQLHNAYIACEYVDRIELIDQHALHERVLFHHLRERFDRGQVERQRLLIPEPLDLLASETALLQEPAVRAAFSKLGFEIGIAGDGDDTAGAPDTDAADGDRPRLVIHAVPTLLARRGAGRRGVHGIVEDTLAAILAEEIPAGFDATVDVHAWDRVNDDTGDAARDPDARRAPPSASLKTGLSWLRRPYLLLATMACKAACKAGDPLTAEAMHALLADAAALPDAYACPHGRPTTLTLSYAALDRYFGR